MDTRPYLTEDDRRSLNRGSPVNVIRAIAREIEAQSGVPQADIFSPKRTAIICSARDVLCHAAHRQGFSYARIGAALGRDPTSIGSAVRREEARRK